MSDPNAWQQRWDAPQPGPPPPMKKRRRWPWVLLVVGLLLTGGCVAVVAVVVDEVSDEVSKTVRVRYAVTGDAENPAISYTTWRDGSEVTNQESAATLPWRKELTTNGFLKGGSLVVTLGPDGGRVTCSVTVDDDAPITATATGPLATASCTGF
ncbi:hypothetical protein [Streptomyces sp. NPDC020681]|uniref:hypothetical protein n=1 Tax=Streptomyces sp. NPDC020681 TaxID=3365083 RepID=UPI00378E5357